jgi:hypothetical protein
MIIITKLIGRKILAKPKSKWPYKTDAPKNREWNKDRKKLFLENGNGWWWYQGTVLWKEKLLEKEERLKS